MSYYYQFDKPKKPNTGFFKFIGRVFLVIIVVCIVITVLTAKEARSRIESGYYSQTSTPTITVTVEAVQGTDLPGD